MLGRLGHDFDLGNAGRALAVGGADAVGTGIAAADDDDVLAGCRNRTIGGSAHLVVAGVALVLLTQEIHRDMNAGQFGAGNIQPAGFFGAAGKHDRVEVFLE